MAGALQATGGTSIEVLANAIHAGAGSKDFFGTAYQHGGAGTAVRLADALNLSLRTLHRQLHEEGTSLQALKDEVRLGRAIDLLSRTARPVKHVVQAVGFRNKKSFARAFRAWTGHAPSAYRSGAVLPR